MDLTVLDPVKSPTIAEVRTFFTSDRPSRQERRRTGREERERVPLESHEQAPITLDRFDPIAVLRGQESDREADLVPLRYERMSADPFAFLRGSAAVMAADLSGTPTTKLRVQLCGDAHLANFGMFASPDRKLVFDVNDFDETTAGPFDWDVKRLAASAAVAARSRGLSDKHARRIAASASEGYRTTMRQLSTARTLDIWYARVDVDALVARLHRDALGKAAEQARSKSRRSTGDRAADKLTTVVDGRRRFRPDPPLLVPVPDDERDAVVDALTPVYVDYLRSLRPDRVALLVRYSFRELARKVVGVGSVGTRALVLLLESGDHEPLLLQVKQAGQSVLEPFVGASRFEHGGKRVVSGQQVLQAASDPFLGWCRGSERTPFDFYVRQLKDMKGSIDPSTLDREALHGYARLCGATLARAHARSSDPSRIAGYLGSSTRFDDAVATFALSYADITDSDHAALVRWRATAGAAAR